MAKPLHDTGASIRFLRAMYGDQPIHLVAIHDKGRIEAATFASADEPSARHWVEARQGTANLYFHVNELKPETRDRKATKQDVAKARFLHVDVDDLEVLPRIEAYDPRPSFVVFSGGGYQAFWPLTEASNDLDGVERRNAKIAQDLGGDNCHNIDRIMRLPGSINIPNAKKRRQGRVEALAYVVGTVAPRTSRYNLDQFEPLELSTNAAAMAIDTIPARVELNSLPATVGEETRLLIQNGDDLGSGLIDPEYEDCGDSYG